MLCLSVCNKEAFLTKESHVVRILCLGDVVGSPGRHGLKEHLKRVREQLLIDAVIANGENSAGGIGITPETIKEMHSFGVDVITTGNHVWRHHTAPAALRDSHTVIRPANFHCEAPGKGFTLFEIPCGKEVISLAVINIIGRIFMSSANCPFEAMNVVLASLPEHVHNIIVDFHAEATSEKRAMAHFLDGRVSAVFGTHTHVQTADAMISSSGTAYLTDLGMCGVVEDSVIGMKVAPVLKRFTTGMPSSFSPATGKISLHGVIVDIDAATGKSTALNLFEHSL